MIGRYYKGETHLGFHPADIMLFLFLLQSHSCHQQTLCDTQEKANPATRRKYKETDIEMV